MRITVERFYRFRASHELPELGLPRHEHDYTVSVVAEQRDSFVAEPGDLFIPTEQIDDYWEKIRPPEGTYLNDRYSDTTVEGLAVTFLGVFRETYPAVVVVTVMEDQQRRGRAEV